MGKKICTVVLVCCFLLPGISWGAVAACQPSENEALENVIISMKSDLQHIDQSGELVFITARTQELLDNLLMVLKDDDSEHLKAVVDDYAADMEFLQVQQLEPACTLPLLVGVYSSVRSMVYIVAAGGDPACLTINLTNSIADLISDILSYKICVIDNSTTPDPVAREKLVRQQVIVETYDFVTNLLYVVYCNPNPTLLDYFWLFMNFLDIFP